MVAPSFQPFKYAFPLLHVNRRPKLKCHGVQMSWGGTDFTLVIGLSVQQNVSQMQQENELICFIVFTTLSLIHSYFSPWPYQYILSSASVLQKLKHLRSIFSRSSFLRLCVLNEALYHRCQKNQKQLCLYPQFSVCIIQAQIMVLEPYTKILERAFLYLNNS